MARKEVVEMAPRTKPHHSGTQRKPLEGAAQPSTRRTRREGRRALESSPPPFQAFTLRERAENIRDRIASCIPQGEGAEAYEDLIPMAQGGCRIPLEEEDLPGWIDQAEQLLILIRTLVRDRRSAGAQQRIEREARDAALCSLESCLNDLLFSPQFADLNKNVSERDEDPIVDLLTQAIRFAYDTTEFRVTWVAQAELLCDLVKIEMERRRREKNRLLSREMQEYIDEQREQAMLRDLDMAWQREEREEEERKELFEVRAEELQEKVERPIQAGRPKEASLSYEGRGRRHPDNRRDKWRRRSRMLWNRHNFEYRWWGGTKKNSF